MSTLTPAERRQAVRNALLAAIKTSGKTCQDLTGKPYVSNLTNAELRAACAALGVDTDAAIATAQANVATNPFQPVPPVSEDGGAALTSDLGPDDAEDFDAPAPKGWDMAQTSTEDARSRAWEALKPLHGFKGLLSETALDAILSGVAGVYAELDATRAELADLKDAPALPVLAPAAKGEDAQPLAMLPASRLFGVKTKRLDGIKLGVWNSPDAPARDPHYVWDAALLEDLALCVNSQEFVWLYGPKGTGKTSAARELAAALGRPFMRIAFNGHVEPRDLLGGDGLNNGNTFWKDGALVKAMRTPGCVVLLDEPTFARPDCMAVLQTVLDHRYVTLEDGTRVEAAQGVLFIVADNTAGRGDESGHYAGTRTQNAALLDRFAVYLPVDYPSATQEALALVNRTGAPQGLADMVVSFAAKSRAKCTQGDLTEGLGFRRLVAFTSRVMAGVDAQRAFETCILNAAHGEDKAALAVLASADLDARAIARAVKGETAQNAATQGATPQSYNDPRNARAATDFSAV